MSRINRRAFTGSVVRDNRIFGIFVRHNGYFGRTQLAYYRRLFPGGAYTGPA